MRIAQTAPAARTFAVTPPVTSPLPRADVADAPWKNPAAASALRSTVQLLASIEDGMVKSFSDAERVKLFAPDLHATNDILTAATDAIMNDANKENDSFLPQLTLAGTGVLAAESRLIDKNFSATWPVQRGDILGAIRKARVISGNVADQLDPNGQHGGFTSASNLGQA